MKLSRAGKFVINLITISQLVIFGKTLQIWCSASEMND